MNNTEQIEKFDPSKLMNGVRDRIKSTFVSLIPDEQWEQMIQKEIKSFFEERKENNTYVRYQPTEFSKIVEELLVEETKKRMAEYLAGEEFQTVWNGKGQTKVSEAVQKMILENSGLILASTIGTQIDMALGALRSQLINQGHNRY